MEYHPYYFNIRRQLELLSEGTVHTGTVLVQQDSSRMSPDAGAGAGSYEAFAFG